MNKKEGGELFKTWLEKEAEKEGLEVEVRITDDDYTAEANEDGTIRIPRVLFSRSFKPDERKAVGSHEIAHLKYNHQE